MRKLFISDIHGCYNQMVQLLGTANYHPGVDQLVIGGDLIDRGPDSGKVIQYAMGLQQTYPDKVIVLQGNHEDMLRMFLANQNDMWMQHGGFEAAQSFEKEKLGMGSLNWLLSRPIIHEDDEYVYVHAGIVPGVPLDKQPKDENLWMPYTNRGIRFSDYPSANISMTTGGKKVIFGHTPKNYVFDDGIRICCDLGAGFTESERKLALVDLTNDIVYQVRTNAKTDQGARVVQRKIARRKTNETGELSRTN